MAKYENVIVITGLARSGTTAVHSKLNDHPSVTTYGEIFHYTAPDENYYKSYLESKKIGAADLLAIGSHVKIFEEYLDWLIERARTEWIVIDVKYPYFHCINSITHGLLRPPRLFSFIRENRMPVLHVIRKNLLRVYISTEIATQYNVWNVKTSESFNKPGKVTINTDVLIKSLRNRQAEIEAVQRHFHNYDRCIELIYEEMFDSSVPGAFRQDFLNTLFGFLDLVQEVDELSGLRKINKGGLADLINNADEVLKALEDSEFAELARFEKQN